MENTLLLKHQKNEITEYEIYKRLARRQKDEHNRQLLMEIAQEELRHYEFWSGLTGMKLAANRFLIYFYYFLSVIFGFTFAVKLMERGETGALEDYESLVGKVDGIEELIRDEIEHEEKLISLLDEERLRYAGSMVLGLNDALVELTGALAGLTLALQNTKLIALSGLITGFAAALSMAASEYLSTKSEKSERNPRKAAFYTGIMYILTVILLIFPYLVLENYFLCLAFTLLVAVLIIAIFNYYIAIAQEEKFSHRFWEMAILSFTVALISFLAGYGFRIVFNVEI